MKTKYLQFLVWLGYRSKCCHAKIYDAPKGWDRIYCAGCDKRL